MQQHDINRIMTQHYHMRAQDQSRMAPSPDIILPWIRTLELGSTRVLVLDSEFMIDTVFPAWTAMQDFRKLVTVPTPRFSVKINRNVGPYTSEVPQPASSSRPNEDHIGNHVLMADLHEQNKNELFSQRFIRYGQTLTDEQRAIPQVVKLCHVFDEKFPDGLQTVDKEKFHYLVFIIKINPVYHYIAVADILNTQLEIVRAQLPSLSVTEEGNIETELRATESTPRLQATQTVLPSRFSQMNGKDGTGTERTGLRTDNLYSGVQGKQIPAVSPYANGRAGLSHTVPGYKGTQKADTTTKRNQNGADGAISVKLQNIIVEQEEILLWFGFFLLQKRLVVQRLIRNDYETYRCTALSMFFLQMRLKEGLKLRQLGLRLKDGYQNWINSFVSVSSLNQNARQRMVRWQNIERELPQTDNLVSEIFLELSTASSLGWSEWVLPLDLASWPNVVQILETQNLRVVYLDDGSRRRIIWDKHVE